MTTLAPPANAIRESILRRKIKMACPKCWRADGLEVAIKLRCHLDEYGRAWFDAGIGSYSSDSDAECLCGWRGEVAEMQDAFSECCSICGADPGSLYREEGEDGRACHECGGSDV